MFTLDSEKPFWKRNWARGILAVIITQILLAYLNNEDFILHYGNKVTYGLLINAGLCAIILILYWYQIQQRDFLRPFP
jgi:hypothetical protein